MVLISCDRPPKIGLKERYIKAFYTVLNVFKSKFKASYFVHLNHFSDTVIPLDSMWRLIVA